MNISVVGISHHAADLAVREALALSGGYVQQLLCALRGDDAFSEALVLDTCNRTEVYFVPASDEASLERILQHIARLKGCDPVSDRSVFYRHDGLDAVEHMFRVAAALDAQIVGEHQILGQLKKAYHQANRERVTGFFMNKLCHKAFKLGKRSQTETNLGAGSTSVAQAAVGLAQQVFSSLTGKAVMLVGAGRTGELAAKTLVRAGVDSVIVANRSIERAQEVAAKTLQLRPEDKIELDVTYPGPSSHRHKTCVAEQSSAPARPRVSSTQAIPLEKIPEMIDKVDLVICATGSPDVVLRADQLGHIIAASNRPLFIVDIAVPRDVDPELGHLANVFLHNMDDLSKIVTKNIEARRQEIPLVEAIISEELESFARWISSLDITPTVKLLRKHFSAISDAEVKRHGKKFTASDREHLEKFAAGLCGKILHHPITLLHALSVDATVTDKLAAVDTIRRIFDLEDMEDDE